MTLCYLKTRTDSNDQFVLEMGAVETKFFQFLLTEEERKDDGKKVYSSNKITNTHNVNIIQMIRSNFYLLQLLTFVSIL